VNKAIADNYYRRFDIDCNDIDLAL